MTLTDKQVSCFPGKNPNKHLEISNSIRGEEKTKDTGFGQVLMINSLSRSSQGEAQVIKLLPRVPSQLSAFCSGYKQRSPGVSDEPLSRVISNFLVHPFVDIQVELSPHPRAFFLQQTETVIETRNWSTCREQQTHGCPSPTNPQHSPTPKAQGTLQKKGGKSPRA